MVSAGTVPPCPRPPHAPIAVRCPHCGSPLEVVDERAQLIVCSHCDGRCELRGPERDTLVRLGASGERTKADYALPLGQSFRWEGARYEVVARMLWVEDDDPRYSTRVYVLYHPRRPLLYLDEYNDVWGLSWRTHVHPVEHPLDIFTGSRASTFDGRSFHCEEVVDRVLWHVDGCLPWQAEVGDAVHALELRGSGRDRFEIELSAGEVEYNEGLILTPAELAAAVPERELEASEPPMSSANRRAMRFAMAGIGILGALLNLAIGFTAPTLGRVVHTQTFAPVELSREVTSDPFDLTGAGLTRLDLRSELDNAWMAVDVALVRGVDKVVHVTGADLSYYHGVEGGERWSEGSRTQTVWLSGVEPGSHRVHLKAVSARGEASTAIEALHEVRLTVYDGAHRGLWGFGGAALCFGIGLLGLLAYAPRTEGDG